MKSTSVIFLVKSAITTLKDLVYFTYIQTYHTNIDCALLYNNSKLFKYLTNNWLRRFLIENNLFAGENERKLIMTINYVSLRNYTNCKYTIIISQFYHNQKVIDYLWSYLKS